MGDKSPKQKNKSRKQKRQKEMREERRRAERTPSPTERAAPHDAPDSPGPRRP